MNMQVCHIVLTLCAVILLVAASIGSNRDGPRFLGRIFTSFTLAMLVTTHMLGIGWAA